MRQDRQLYDHTGQRYRLPSFIDAEEKVVTRRASEIPVLHWPDGRWCIEANVFLLEELENGGSIRNRGGSLVTYASQISHLIRFCYENKASDGRRTSFHELTDNQFAMFIRGLSAERDVNHPRNRRRQPRTVVAIGRCCLDFLDCVGRLYRHSDFVSPTGRIRAERRQSEIRPHAASPKVIVRPYWHHWAFPHTSPMSRRHPISDADISNLREAIIKSTRDVRLRRRRYEMLRVLETTGGRRGEVAALTVESVFNAANSPDCLLELITLKQRGDVGAKRFIPVAGHDVALLVSYIDKSRSGIPGVQRYSGYVFLNINTGKPLRPNTISQEMRLLRRLAGLTGKACAHMFRNRYITKLFVALIQQHKFQNPDDFRQALLDSESLKERIRQYTGHKDTGSLGGYIDLAFDEITNFGPMLNTVQLRTTVDSFRRALDEFKLELHTEGNSKAMSAKLELLVEALSGDLDRLGKDRTKG